MSKPKFKIGDEFLEEDGMIDEVVFVAPTITDDGHWSYFVKVTSKDIPNWLKYDYTYENFLEKYCVKLGDNLNGKLSYSND